jgi:hypothetical protein
LQTETAACLAARKAHAEDTSEFAVHLKRVGLRLKEKFDERERAMLHELAVQKDEFRQLQVRVAAARPPLLLDDMVAGPATSSRVAPNLRTDIGWHDISSQKSDDNVDLKMWQQNLPHVAGTTMPTGLKDTDGTFSTERVDEIAFESRALCFCYGNRKELCILSHLLLCFFCVARCVLLAFFTSFSTR